MPQSWEEHWPLAPNVNEEAALEENKARIHAIGTISHILTGSLNPGDIHWTSRRTNVQRSFGTTRSI